MALGAALLLAACGEYDSLKRVDSFDHIDWSAKLDEYSQPGPLGTFFNRKPPPVWIRASSPYPGPLSEPAPPLLTAEMIDQVVAAPLRPLLTAEARANLAQASVLAASAATGTAVAWKAADAGGSVVPARDVYLSRHGLVCRDLRQQVQKRDSEQAAPVTLCREDRGDSRIGWLPGSPD
jgi:surface antigen